jgi:C1A family cysteine protease
VAAPGVDLRPALPAVRDQGLRGTCVAFAVTAAHELDREAGGAAAEHLSEEALYWGCKVLDGQWHAGTRFVSAATALTTTGQPPDAVWPYDENRPDGIAYAPPAAPDASWHTSSLTVVNADVTTIRAELDNGRPTVLGVVVYDTMFAPTAAGRVELPPVGAPSRGRHAVLAVGYGADGLLIRNSWGATWALGGYGWLTDAYCSQHLREAWSVGARTPTATTTPPAVTATGDVYGSQ